jgi:hypothetical protein
MKRIFNISVATFILAFSIILSGAASDAKALQVLPTQESQDQNTSFVVLARELDQLQVFFGGGDGQPLTFDSDAARQQGFSSQSIKLAEEMAAFTNDLLTIANEVVEKSDNRKQFGSLKEKAEIVMQQAASKLENYPVLNSFLDAASQWQYQEAVRAENGIQKLDLGLDAFTFETPATVCGGFLTPRPSRSATAVKFSSNNPWNTLYQWGYHPTPDYVAWKVPAGGGWTRPQTYRPDMCKWNSFRDHAWIVPPKTIWEQKYTGWSPNGEPNPEVWNYSPWPYPAWPAYVFFWHQTH